MTFSSWNKCCYPCAQQKKLDVFYLFVPLTLKERWINITMFYIFFFTYLTRIIPNIWCKLKWTKHSDIYFKSGYDSYNIVLYFTRCSLVPLLFRSTWLCLLKSFLCFLEFILFRAGFGFFLWKERKVEYSIIHNWLCSLAVKCHWNQRLMTENWKMIVHIVQYVCGLTVSIQMNADYFQGLIISLAFLKSLLQPCQGCASVWKWFEVSSQWLV